MNQFLLAHSSDKPAQKLVDDCIQQLGDIPPEATFGFLYISDQLCEESASILQQLQAATHIHFWAGCTSSNLISSNQEYYNQPAIVIMLADFNESDFYILPNLKQNTDALDDDITHWCSNNDFNIGLIHADPDNQAIQPLMQQLGTEIPDAFLIGGLCAGNTQNLQFANDILSGGISGVLFSQQVSILSTLTQGCTPIGPRHKVTQCDGNVALTLDDKPALEVLADDTGDIIARDWEQASDYIFAGLINKHSDMDDYTIRQLIGVDSENNFFAISDYLEHDQDIIFCRRDGNSAQKDMQRMLLKIQSRLNSPIKGGIYISCVGRGREQFGANSEEVRLIHSVLGNFPLVGFFANGEIHKNRLYAFTGVLTLFT